MQAQRGLEPRLAVALHPVPAPGHFEKEFLPLVIPGGRYLARFPVRSHTFAASTGSKGFGPQTATPKKAKKSKGPQETSYVPPFEQDKSLCPCCSGRKYEECCEPYHVGSKAPPTPETLMRSRFAAYVKGGSLAVRYICDTTHPDNDAAGGSKRPDGTHASSLAEDVAATCKSVTFLRLKLREVEGGSSEDEGFVTFQWWYKIVNQQGQRQKGNAVGSIKERSRFVRENGTWLYVNGATEVVTPDGLLHA